MMPSTRQLTTAFALGRLAFGVGLMARPDRVASGWIGEDAEKGAAVSTLAAPASSLPGNARWGTVALGGGSALAGALLLAGLKQ